MATISASEVRTHEIVLVPNYREGQAYGTVVIAFHIGMREYHVLAKLRKRQLPQGVPAHIVPMAMRNSGFMHQTGGSGSAQVEVLFGHKDFGKVVEWINRRFNLHLDAKE
jgi:hypothetical protein